MASNSRPLALLIALVSLPGCDALEEPGAAPVRDFDAVAIPSHLDFGEVDQGVAHWLSASVQNVGDVRGEVVQVTSSAGQLATDLRPGTLLPANGFVGFSVGWLPGAGATLDDTVTVRIAHGAGNEDSISLPVSGHAIGPVLAVSTDTLDVGFVGVGCSASALLTVENLGNDVLRVEDVALTADREFQLGDTAGEALTLPWVLAPGATESARLTYTPTAEAQQSAHIVLTTNDIFSPTVELDITGRGSGVWITQDEGAHEEAIAAIVFANEVLLSFYWAPFEAALPVFFETLLARRVPFRIAFTADATGNIIGDSPYIDESVPPAGATNLVSAMLGEPMKTDIDQILYSLVEAVEHNRSWLLDESSLWEASQLNLVGVNNDQEQSGASAQVYVNELATYKLAGAELVTVHAIAGDEPGGCDTARPAGALYDATVLTGGTFASICEPNWEASMVALAKGMPGSSARLFGLDETPAEGSLTVAVDGVLVESGWTYSKTGNSVLFDEVSRPENGSIVTLHYAKVCEGA